ncbi:MAG: DUF4157 domain-containing protein [Chthoniobacterales bacterium]
MNQRIQKALPLPSFTKVLSGVLQRKCACGGTPGLTGECEACREKKLQRRPSTLPGSSSIKPQPPTAAQVPPIVHDVLRSPGQPLESAARTFMEPRFGLDFSRVPIVAQSKLALSTGEDSFEQEADRMAGQVMGASVSIAPELGKVSKLSPTRAIQPKARSSALIDVLPTPRPNAATARVREASGFDAVAADDSVTRPGFNFAKVRVHTGEQAAEAARSLNARAFTIGNDIVFGAAEYAPQTEAGRFLLAHELAHTLQQSESNPYLVQRKITVQNPASQTPNIPIPWATMTNAEIVEQWCNELCRDGAWTVDRATGVVASSVGATFCAAEAQIPYKHFSLGGNPVSCECLCFMVTPAAPDVRLHAANFVTLPSGPFDVHAVGEGRTRPPDAAAGRPETNVGVSGIQAVGVTGVGDTHPQSGTGRTQVLRDPPWIILGHELCGHARLGALPHVGHSTTPEGNRSAVDIENQIRREHSTTANDLGIRRGEFTSTDGARHFGSVYQSSAGETLATIATRVGIAVADRLSHIWRENGAPITAATANTLAVGERLLIENVFWHQVITGETAQSIAATWGVTLASLQTANPSLAGANPAVTAGQRLLIPAS